MQAKFTGSILGIALGTASALPALARDTTPPVITANVTGITGTNGWYTSNVGVAWTVTDAESRISKSSGCGSASVTTDTAGVTFTCKATSTGGTSTQSVTVKRDATLPTATITTPVANASYKQNQVVAASYACGDARSGTASCSGTVANGSAIDTASVGTKSFTVTATDLAGNAFTKTASYTVSDATPPVITPTITGTLGSNGWYTSNVGVTWTVTDAETAVTSSSGCGAVTVSTDTAGTTYTCSATSTGGTATKSVTVKRDATKPSASIVRPANGATYSQGQSLTASYSCADAVSGIATCAGTVANGASINLSSTGTKSFTVTSTDLAGNSATSTVTYTVSSSSTGSTNAQLLAWNDLGMHCMDSDYSVFTLLPPFNTLNAQLVANGKLVGAGAGYGLSFEAQADPSGSINTYSVGKTNFWTWVGPLFGANPGVGLGLTGTPTATTTKTDMSWNDLYNWFEATGIPVTPIDDTLAENYFPMVKVKATDSTGKEIASAGTVLPVSSEINCNTCHASGTGSNAAMPNGGWVTGEEKTEKEWRLNILRLHDEKNAGKTITGKDGVTKTYAQLMADKGYGTSLESSAKTGKPVLCDTCHNSNALAVWGIKGVDGVSNMTAAMHNRHAGTSLPGSLQTLDSDPTRESCYNCHPGRKTQCLRGAMGNPVDGAGKHTMECQSCHGSMLTVGNKAREGWFDMPTCQACHHDGKRETVAINAGGSFKSWTDSRFASNDNTPATGWNLYRFSTGHGKLQCQACHGSTHAEFTSKPSASGNQVNDNLRAVQAQGYAAAIRECKACHASVPQTNTGGPHGMHEIGSSFVTRHHDVVPGSLTVPSECAYCHGTTSSGSPLAVIKVAKTFSIGDSRTKTFAAEEKVTCWSCHNGPKP